MGILSVLLLFTFDWYLLRLIVLLKPDYNCCNSFALSWVGKITTRTRIVVSVIANFSTPAESVITQVDEQVRMRLVSQLIKGISRVLQKLLKYFSGIIISTFSMCLSSLVLPIIFDVKLNESVSLVPSKIKILPSSFTAGISLQYCLKLSDVFE